MACRGHAKPAKLRDCLGHCHDRGLRLYAEAPNSCTGPRVLCVPSFTDSPQSKQMLRVILLSSLSFCGGGDPGEV